MSIGRRSFLKTATGGMLAATLPGVVSLANQKAAQQRPNVIYIVADDMGWGDLGCYGHPEIETPNLDRLAAQGTLFTNYYVNSPVCSPSRAAMMSGRFPAHLGILFPITPSAAQNQRWGNRDYLDPSIPILTREMKKAGYATGHFGKWHLGGPENSPSPDKYGIDDHVTGFPHAAPENRLEGEPRYIIEMTDDIFNHAIDFVKKNQEKPFYANVWTPVPHTPIHPSAEQMEPYSDLAPGAGVPWPGAKQVYYAAITHLDEHVGRLLDELDRLGLTDKTMVVFSSDNGPENIHYKQATHSGIGSPGPFRGHKASIYEGGIRVPFIVKWPGHVPSGRIEKRSVLAAVDLLPTFCSLAGAKFPPNTKEAFDGEDASDVLLGASRARTRPIYWENAYWYYDSMNPHPINKSPLLAVREGDWKLLMNPDGSRVELYNLRRDPMEVDNKADVHPELANRLSEKLLKWKESTPEGPRAYPPDAGDNTYDWPGGSEVLD